MPSNRPRWLMAALISTAASTALAGCGSSGSNAAPQPPNLTSSAPPTPTTSSAVPPAVVPTGNIPRALVGTYTYSQFGEKWNVTLRSDGTYAQWNPSGDLDMTGHYGTRGQLAVFSDQATDQTHGNACPEPGVYRWHLARTKLVMSKKQDDCTVGRIQQWTAGWTKVSATALKDAPTLAEARKS